MSTRAKRRLDRARPIGGKRLTAIDFLNSAQKRFITGVTLRHLTYDPTLKSAPVVSRMKENLFISKGRSRSIVRTLPAGRSGVLQ